MFLFQMPHILLLVILFSSFTSSFSLLKKSFESLRITKKRDVSTFDTPEFRTTDFARLVSLVRTNGRFSARHVNAHKIHKAVVAAATDVAGREKIASAATTLLALALTNGMLSSTQSQSTLTNSLTSDAIATTLSRWLLPLDKALVQEYKRHVKTGEKPVAAMGAAMELIGADRQPIVEESEEEKPPVFRSWQVGPDMQPLNPPSNNENNGPTKAVQKSSSIRDVPKRVNEHLRDEMNGWAIRKWSSNDEYPALSCNSPPSVLLDFENNWRRFQQFVEALTVICLSVINSTTYNDIDQLLR